MSYIQSLDVKSIYRLAQKAKEREEDSKLFKMFCASMPYFEEAMSFEEWKEERKSRQRTIMTYKSDDEIMREIEGIDV